MEQPFPAMYNNCGRLEKAQVEIQDEKELL
jgi:hypothetical protein